MRGGGGGRSNFRSQGPLGNNGQVVLGGVYQLTGGQSLNGDLAIIGGQGTLEKNSTVNGSVFIIGGTLTVSGKIQGDITSIGGTISLDATAYLSGNINTIGGVLSKSPQATVIGKVNQDTRPSLNFPIPPVVHPQAGFFCITIPHNRFSLSVRARAPRRSS